VRLVTLPIPFLTLCGHAVAAAASLGIAARYGQCALPLCSGSVPCTGGVLAGCTMVALRRYRLSAWCWAMLGEPFRQALSEAAACSPSRCQAGSI